MDGGEELGSPPSFGGGGEIPGGDLDTATAGGGEEALPSAEVTPESRKKDMNILVENNLIEGSQMINLGQAQDSLGEISKHLDKLLNS
jgi:hypothetical protein